LTIVQSSIVNKNTLPVLHGKGVGLLQREGLKPNAPPIQSKTTSAEGWDDAHDDGGNALLDLA
jgi:hypothetical protein